jgi:Fe-S protein assembly co-chaperone HscB
MQSAVHPDILKSKGIEEHNFSKLLQESFKTLSDDLSRAKYMVSFIQLFLKGIDSEKVEINDLDYLEDQLETRGKITFAEQQELRSIQKTAESNFESLKIQLALLFDSEDYEQAKVLTAKLNFSAKILEETKERLNFL